MLFADWYFWFPLYTLACAANLINCRRISKSTRIKQMIGTTLSLGLFLFFKAVAEDVITEKVGVLSLDLTQRVVREKIGSGLVIASMVLQQRAYSSKTQIDFGKKKKKKTLDQRVSNFKTLIRFLNDLRDDCNCNLWLWTSLLVLHN